MPNWIRDSSQGKWVPDQEDMHDSFLIRPANVVLTIITVYVVSIHLEVTPLTASSIMQAVKNCLQPKECINMLNQVFMQCN